eukprot:scaffold8103_cov34-Phaeocystis_antarctica.AAC.2
MGPSCLIAQIFPLRGPRGALRAARYAGRATRAGVLRTARYRYRWSDPTYEKKVTARVRLRAASGHNVKALGRSARVCASPACAASNDCFFTSFRARARGLVVLERLGVKELGRSR